VITSLPVSRVPDPSLAPPLRWGVLGPGGIARAFARSVLKHSRQQLIAVGSRTAQRAETFAAEFGSPRVHSSYESLVTDPDVDVVYVATPHSHHHAQALLAIAAGKHVLVEKAFTRNAAEARGVAEAARAAGVVALEAMWTRFLPGADVLRQLLAAGELGEIVTVAADFGLPIGPEDAARLHDPALAGGALLDLGVYPVSYASFVLGAPTGVVARGTLTETGVDRQVSAVLTYASAAQSVVHTTLAARTPTVAAISGSEARIELDGPFYAPGVVRLVTRDGEVRESAPPVIEGHLGLCHQAAHLAQLVADGASESPLLPWAETIAVMEPLDELRAQVGVRYPGE